jgi:hypothetical protein
MPLTKVLDNVADTTSSGDITSTSNSVIVRCSAGSVDVKFDSGVAYQSIIAGDGYIFDINRGDVYTVVATAASTTAYAGDRPERGG